MTETLVRRLRRLRPWLGATCSAVPAADASTFIPVESNSFQSVKATASYEKQRCGAIYLVRQTVENGIAGSRVTRMESPVRLGRRKLLDPQPASGGLSRDSAIREAAQPVCSDLGAAR